jgi:hypothetical protein
MQGKTSRRVIATFIVLAALLTYVPAGWGATETVLYSFKDLDDGSGPEGVIRVNGRLYGTTGGGGIYQNGTIFELAHEKSGWVKNTLYKFTGKNGMDNPGVLVADRHGNLYGASAGGPYGVIFELSPRSEGRWRFGVIYSFGKAIGGGPEYLTIDDAGNLCGATSSGGGRGQECGFEGGCGTVYELSRSTHGWRISVLHRFGGGDGRGPEMPLYRDTAGNLYGTTKFGGGRGCSGTGGCGTVFELSPAGGGWKFAVLHRFSGPDGIGPGGPLAMDGSGNLYGTAPSEPGNGIVFKLARGSNGWKESILHRFSRSRDGNGPDDGVVLDGSGGMYGVTEEGGASGAGAIFEIKPSGDGWEESVPFSFDGEDGLYPASLVSGSNGKYYGTTGEGGDGECSGGCGVVYEFVP